MSLVIATNKDQDTTFRQDESVYSAYSFKNDLSSAYKIPPNSQVALQSCKVNLDGRITISANNSWWYDYFGEDLDDVEKLDDTGAEVDIKAIELTTSYPLLQDLQVPKGEILELTTDELATRLKDKHREYHPNLMGKFSVAVKRSSGLDFLGFEFNYNQNSSQNASTKPDKNEPFYVEDGTKRYSYNASSVFTRLTGTYEDPAVGIFLGKPLDLSNGSMSVDIQNANASGVPWGVGLSRDCPNPYLRTDEAFKPYYFDNLDDADESFSMGIDDADYFEDFGVHRNSDGELVLRHAVSTNNGEDMVHKEVKYWLNASSVFNGTGGRYDIATNGSGFTSIKYVCKGEQVEVYGVNASGDQLITAYEGTSPKTSYFKPITQTCWCLHPVLYVGFNDATSSLTNSLTLSSYSGLNITNYDSRKDSDKSKKGWFETASLLSNIISWNFINRCRDLDMRAILDPSKSNDPYDYVPVGLSNKGINHKYVMILTPNNEYTPTFGSACSDLFGFPGRSLVIDGIGTFPNITFASDEAPDLNCMKSIFVRLNGFGQQVMNARTGNKSTILSHLPTADSRATAGSSQRIFYEPKNLIFLDLKNPYEMVVSDFSIDFVYSNEQYAKILQGQSIVCLYFKTKDNKMIEVN